MDINKYMTADSEKPLDNIVTDGGFCGIFRTIACVGDSLSSGEFQLPDGEGKWKYYDHFEYSWGQYIARKTGSKVYNFSRGGMTAKAYCDHFAQNNDYWNPDKKCQAYIIALGVNDFFWVKHTVGSMDDVDLNDYNNNNKETIYGNYATIIARYKEIQPDAKFFLVTVANENSEGEHLKKAKEQVKMIYDMAEAFDNTYVIDLYKYAPVYDKQFKKHFYLNGHMTPTGYMLTADIISSYIDYIIRHNSEDFKLVGMIDTNL